MKLEPKKPLWIAWRGVGGFGLWHRSYDPEHRWTTCGKQPSGITDTRTKAPKPEQECATCRQRDALRVQHHAETPRMW